MMSGDKRIAVAPVYRFAGLRGRSLRRPQAVRLPCAASYRAGVTTICELQPYEAAYAYVSYVIETADGVGRKLPGTAVFQFPLSPGRTGLSRQGTRCRLTVRGLDTPWREVQNAPFGLTGSNGHWAM